MIIFFRFSEEDRSAPVILRLWGCASFTNLKTYEMSCRVSSQSLQVHN